MTIHFSEITNKTHASQHKHVNCHVRVLTYYRINSSGAWFATHSVLTSNFDEYDNMNTLLTNQIIGNVRI